MEEGQKYWTIPKFAKRLGITPASIRDWIERGYVEEPPELPVTRERAYPAEAADRIEQWYLRRAANGGTRGPGAKARRQRARARLEVGEVEPVFTLVEGGDN